MIDNEIIKALECCIHSCCVGCPCADDDANSCNYDKKYVLDLINRKNAEIDRLKDENKSIRYCYEQAKSYNDTLAESCEKNCKKFNMTTRAEAIKGVIKKINELLERYSAIHNSAEIAMQDVIECDNETIEMQSVWDVHTLIANEMGSEPEEMNRLQDNIETIAKERLLKEIEKDFRLLVKEMTEVQK